MPRWCPLITLLWLTTVFPSAGVAQTEEGVVRAGWKTHQPAYAPPATYPAGPGVPTPLASGPGRTVFEELPDDTGWLYEDSPLERILKETFRHAYFRAEYLLWDISDPGENVLSGPTDSPTFLYPPDLVRNPANPTGPLIPPSIFSVGEGPAQPANSRMLRDGGGRRFVLPPVFQVTNPELLTTSQALQPVLIVTQPTMEGVHTAENNGIRGTFGIELPVGAFEGSVFTLSPSSTKFAPVPFQFLDFADIDDSDGDGILGDGNTTEYLPTFNAPAQAITVNGQVPIAPPTVVPTLPFPQNPLGPLDPPLTSPLLRGDNLRIIWGVTIPDPDNFNARIFVPSYQATLNTQVWGSEGNYLAPAFDQGSLLQLQPMLGFRYMNFEEELLQRGFYTFSSINPGNAQLERRDVPRRIDSSTTNHFYGPQIGVRAELRHKKFSIGAQPKVMLGLNSYEAQLQTENVLRPAFAVPGVTPDRNQFLTLNESTFGVVSDLEVFSRVHLTDHLSIFVAYNFLWAGNLTRPADNIVYNARSILPVTDPPTAPVSELDLESDFQLDIEHSSAILQGISVGGEIKY